MKSVIVAVEQHRESRFTGNVRVFENANALEHYAKELGYDTRWFSKSHGQMFGGMHSDRWDFYCEVVFPDIE